MANMSQAMVRNLQNFVEGNFGNRTWETTQLAKIKTEDGASLVAKVGGVGGHEIQVDSPDVDSKYPLGRIWLNGRPQGPIDQKTWDKVASEMGHMSGYSR